MNSTKNGRSLSILNKARKWEKVVESIVKYTRSSSMLAYPLDFFYQLEKIVSGGHTLKLNIAATLTGAKDNYIRTVFTSNEEVGTVQFTGGIIKSTFDFDVEKQNQQRIAKLCERDQQFNLFYKSLKDNNICDQILPSIIIKEKSMDEKIGQSCSIGTAVDYRVITLSKDQYKKIINLETTQIAQCFILGNGKQASIIRFFYFPNKQNSEAFKIDNVQGFMKRRFGKGQFKVRQQSQSSLTFVKIMFINKSFYQQTLQLISMLERQMKITISKIVCDWVMDPFNRYFLIDIKEVSFQAKLSSTFPQKSLTQTLAYITCSVCQQKYCGTEITKILTDKLIFEFFQHLKKRQIILSFNQVYHKTSNISRVCDLCFMLIVSQSELMQLERSISKVTHSIKDEQIKRISPYNAINKSGKMFQWRLFLYLEDIRNLIIEEFDSKINYYVIVRLHNSLTSFKLKESANNYNLVKGIKIHYLFSEHDKIQDFLVKSQISIRITRGNNWNSVLAEGSTSGLYQQSEKYSMRKFKQILVFNQKSKYSVVGMHIGIRLEGKSDPPISSLYKYHDAFMVDEGYSNCYSLPAEWMETIDPSYCVNQLQPPLSKFQLHLNNHEKTKILPILNNPQRKRLIL